MKTLKPTLIAFLLFLSVGFVIQCQHDDEEIIPIKGPDPIERGTETLTCTNCTPLVSNGAPSDFSATNVPVGAWYCDKAHSNVMWETPYKVFGSLLTGRFNYFVLEDLSFDEANPSSISFKGYVRLNSVNTGEPGRDAGCLAGNGATSTFKTTVDMTTEPENQATLISKSGTGRYSETDEGFFVDADMTFLGVTKTVTVKLFYEKQTDQGTFTMAGISAEYTFKAITDYAVASTNIDDEVKIRINTLLRNKK
jgi:polyisoprenoid-binding protein YceI